jgi:hypothetical protein
MRMTLRMAARRLALAVASVIAVGGGPLNAWGQGEGLSLQEILDMRRRGVPTGRIVRSAQEYCVGFAVNDTIERRLLAVGADTTLIDGIRQSCVVTTPLVQLAAGVLLDDNLTTMAGLPWFSAADRLCTVRPDRQGLRVENRRGSTGCAIGYPFDLAAASVRIELTISELQGARGAMAALGFGRDSYSWDQYSFGITTDDRFELCLSVAGRCKPLVAQKRAGSVSMAGAMRAATRGGPADTVRRREVRLAIEIRGRDVVLFIDDERVGTHTASEALSGGLSLSVGARSTAVFRRLRVQRLEGAVSARE